MPSISERIAVITKPGDLRNWRRAKRRSCSRVHIGVSVTKDTDLDEICFRRIDGLRKDLQFRRLLAPLLVAQRNHRIDAHRPPRGKITCEQSHSRQQRRYRSENGGISLADAEKQAGEEPVET